MPRTADELRPMSHSLYGWRNSHRSGAKRAANAAKRNSSLLCRIFTPGSPASTSNDGNNECVPSARQPIGKYSDKENKFRQQLRVTSFTLSAPVSSMTSF